LLHRKANEVQPDYFDSLCALMQSAELKSFCKISLDSYITSVASSFWRDSQHSFLDSTLSRFATVRKAVDKKALLGQSRTSKRLKKEN
jgi:hypothetical protein